MAQIPESKDNNITGDAKMDTIQVGDFVKGLPGSGYSITNDKMARGVVTKVSDGMITVKVLDHMDGRSGEFDVNPEFFEVIGHCKPFIRDEVLNLLRNGCKKAILGYDLSDADLSDADLSGADLSGADLSGADLRRANLRRANLSDADLSGANLSDANLSGAEIDDKTDFDFACWPLWCGSLGIKAKGTRQAVQLAYHLCSMQCDDAEYIAMRNSILGFANKFHRVDECGKLMPTPAPDEATP